MVRKEDAGRYTATVCSSTQHCFYQRKFQLHVHGHLVRGLVGDCVTFDLNCLQSARYIHVMWKKDNQRVAKIKPEANVSVIYCDRAHVFPNGSLSRCPTQRRDEGEYVADVFGQDGVHLHQETFNLELNIWITVPSIQYASLILTDERDSPEECEGRDENNPCSQNDENPSVQGLDGTNSPEQRSKDLLRSNKEANPATAVTVTYSSVSKLQDYVPSGSRVSWKHGEEDVSSQYALIMKSTRGLPGDKPGDPVCSSSPWICQERRPQYWT
ncbi:uncharacterized protein LOC113481425 [Athene cunicularia]|uniref:uncharacterized protein LOC113481425 n=1 Tax=Athene cunicularia TaxID=194338 RepID=UPI000EF65B3F|nr:uncharacterized protein LOC113481425 [Athene cunicularia]